MNRQDKLKRYLKEREKYLKHMLKKYKAENSKKTFEMMLYENHKLQEFVEADGDEQAAAIVQQVNRNNELQGPEVG